MKVIKLGNIQINIDKGDIPETFVAVVVVLFCADKFVMVWNPERGWEFPGGHREGSETWEETAIREVWEEARIEIWNLTYLGYYTQKIGHLTLIVYAECSHFEELDQKILASEVDVFDRLPSQLSYEDGREQLFLDVASKLRNFS